MASPTRDDRLYKLGRMPPPGPAELALPPRMRTAECHKPIAAIHTHVERHGWGEGRLWASWVTDTLQQSDTQDEQQQEGQGTHSPLLGAPPPLLRRSLDVTSYHAQVVRRAAQIQRERKVAASEQGSSRKVEAIKMRLAAARAYADAATVRNMQQRPRSGTSSGDTGSTSRCGAGNSHGGAGAAGVHAMQPLVEEGQRARGSLPAVRVVREPVTAAEAAGQGAMPPPLQEAEVAAAADGDGTWCAPPAGAASTQAAPGCQVDPVDGSGSETAAAAAGAGDEEQGWWEQQLPPPSQSQQEQPGEGQRSLTADASDGGGLLDSQGACQRLLALGGGGMQQQGEGGAASGEAGAGEAPPAARRDPAWSPRRTMCIRGQGGSQAAVQPAAASALQLEHGGRSRTSSSGGGGSKRTPGTPRMAGGSAAGSCGTCEALPLDAAMLAKLGVQVAEQGVVLPPLCSCGHRVSALHPRYVAACCTNCPLRGNMATWQRLLASALAARGLLLPTQSLAKAAAPR